MAISIKCAGCQAAFDVPETLDGKTIRCTSCKTQLVVAAKKPASPLPPVRSKPVIEVDDDEEKTRPSRSTGSKAGKLSPRRRDDDEDDDDEEEEEDERPRKGKKKPAPKGGNGAKIAIFGGLGVLVCGGLAAAIYFATASDDKKKDAGSDTAANGNSSAPSMPMGKNFGSKGGPPGSKGGPPGGKMPMPSNGGTTAPSMNVNANAGSTDASVPSGWKMVNGPGFSFSMPAEPKSSVVNGDQDSKATVYAHETPDKKAMFAIFATDVPPDADAQLIFNLLAGDAAPAASEEPPVPKGRPGRLGQGPGTRGPRRPNFRGGMNFGRMNGTMKLSNKRSVTVGGFPAMDFDAVSGPHKLTGRALVGGGKFVLALCGHETDPNFGRIDGAKFLDTVRITNGQMASAAPGPNNNYPGPMGIPQPMGVPGPMGSFPGPMGATGPMGSGSFSRRPGNVPGPMGAPPPNQFTPGPMGAPSPMGIPQPMGGPTGLPQPMGVPPSNNFPPGSGVPPQNNNFPPGPMNGFGPPSRAAGETVRPPLAARIEAFNAIAVDVDQGHAYTVSVRKDPKAYSKVLGTLTRYSYPEFKSPTTFNLPFAATRAVIDSKSGMLYLAAVTAKTYAIERAGFDRTHGTGDIQIYDLAPIRDGKAAAESNLKPVATIVQGGDICGLELSNDGKFLYVAVTKPTGKPRSHIKKYDLNDRKMVKDVPLPADAYDMQKSADGKKLFVIEHLRNSKAKNLQIMTCDLETMKVESFRAPGLALDIASAPDDTLVISVEKPMAPAANFNGGGNGFGNPGGGGNGFGPPRNGQFGNAGGGRRGGGRGGPQPGGIYGQPGSGVNPPPQSGGGIYGQPSGNLGNGNQKPVLPPLEGELHSVTADRSNTQFSLAWTASH
ncbi:MAG TPA: hypothetical protein VGI99_07770, partial [Gemmataceae bacterium]